MATYLLVGNPEAQSGKNKERIERALSLLRSRGADAELLWTLPEGRTIEAVRGAIERSRPRVVIAMGGDGTFREVGSALIASPAREDVALAMLPTGTANDQGKSFGLDASPEALEENVQVILEGKETRLDAGEARTENTVDYFFDSAGWGLSARVLAQRNRDRATVASIGSLQEVYRDHALYAGAFLKTFLESYVVDDRIHATAILDGRTLELDGVTDLIVKNTRIYAGAWVFDKTSRHDDGSFELVSFRGKLEWAASAIIDINGIPIAENTLNEFGVSRPEPLRARVIELSLEAPPEGAPLAAQLDGEEWPPCSRVRIEVLPQALRLIVPELSLAPLER